MNLYNDDNVLFGQLVNITATAKHVPEQIVVKDYFLSNLLADIQKRNDEIVFKGGTSLSKALHIIERFSEDIDLAYTEVEFKNIGVSKRNKDMFHLIKNVIEAQGLLINENALPSSGMKHHVFEVEYPHEGQAKFLHPDIKVETYIFNSSFPTIKVPVQSMIGEQLASMGRQNVIEAFPELKPFLSRVQSPERTLIDKVLAVADSYEQRQRNLVQKKTANQIRSRDIFDIWKLLKFLTNKYEWEKLEDTVTATREQLAPMRGNITSVRGENPWQAFLKALNSPEMEKDWTTTASQLLQPDEKITFEDLRTELMRAENFDKLQVAFDNSGSNMN